MKGILSCNLLLFLSFVFFLEIRISFAHSCVGFKQISAGNNFALGLCDNTVYSWGDTTFYQTADGVLPTKRKPGPAALLQDKSILQVAAGSNFGLALDASQQTIYSFGGGSSGQLGDSFRNYKSTLTSVKTTAIFQQFGNSTIITQIAAGHLHSALVLSNGIVYAWGSNGSGQLGNNSTTTSATPIQVNMTQWGFENVSLVAVCCGQAHTLSVDSNGIVYAWGQNSEGQLAHGNWVSQLTPIISQSLVNMRITSISAGYYFSLFMDNNSTAWVAGNNDKAQLGDATADQKINWRASIRSIRFAKISAGKAHALGISEAGNIFAWGDNNNFQVSSSTEGVVPTPTMVDFPSRLSLKQSNVSFVQIVGNWDFSLALGSNGIVYGWGNGDKGQMGVGITDQTKTRAQFPVVVACPDPNFGGDNCTTPVCFGYLATDYDFVCSNGNGACVSPDKCSCRSGYEGVKCENITCFGVSVGAANICSGHGSCVGPNTCNCQIGYNGDNCQQFSCGGLLPTDPNVCSKSGKCVALDSCVCESFCGPNCEKTAFLAAQSTLFAAAIPTSITITLIAICCPFFICYVVTVAICALALFISSGGSATICSLCGCGTSCLGSSSLFCCGSGLLETLQLCSCCGIFSFCGLWATKSQKNSKEYQKLILENQMIKNKLEHHKKLAEIHQHEISGITENYETKITATNKKMTQIRKEADERISRLTNFYEQKLKNPNESKSANPEQIQIQIQNLNLFEIEDQIARIIGEFVDNGFSPKDLQIFKDSLDEKKQRFIENEKQLKEKVILHQNSSQIEKNDTNSDFSVFKKKRRLYLEEIKRGLTLVKEKIDLGLKQFKKYGYQDNVNNHLTPFENLNKFISEFKAFEREFYQETKNELERYVITNDFLESRIVELETLLEESSKNRREKLQIQVALGKSQQMPSSTSEVSMDALESEKTKIKKKKKEIKSSIRRIIEEIASLTQQQDMFLDVMADANELVAKHKFILKGRAQGASDKIIRIEEKIVEGLKEKYKSLLIPRFEIEKIEKIGKGGFAKVYKGLYQGKTVALKLFPLEFDDSKSLEN